MRTMNHLKIHPLNIEGLSEAENRGVEDRLMKILRSWDGTPHMDGQQCRGVAVDCVRFVSAVLDELAGTSTQLDRLPQDASFHNADVCTKALRRFMKAFPSRTVEDGEMQPGDVLITGPKNGGPGHAIVAGADGALWHCDGSFVSRMGLSLNGQGVFVLKTIKRPLNRERWLRGNP